ncbi:MAG TPA: hypothetical protein VLD62_08515 [Acidimicrobiia bacterium]|nr:hypothetical protein [Acidimicrobiia bacterium]
MRLGIDLDGVVADFNAGWINRYNAEFHGDVAHDAVRHWNAIPSLTHFEDMEAFWMWAQGDPGSGSLFRHLETYPGSVETLGRLDRAGHDIVIITTKPRWAIHDTFAWLSQHRLPTEEVHITWNKQRVPCDVYLDDAPHVIERIHRARPEALVCRFVRPWNRPVAGVRDVHDWPEFESVVLDLAKSGIG